MRKRVEWSRQFSGEPNAGISSFTGRRCHGRQRRSIWEAFLAEALGEGMANEEEEEEEEEEEDEDVCHDEAQEV